MWNISILAVVLAALAGFLIGGLWYGPLFLKTWQREAGISTEDMQRRHPAWIFGGAFVLQLCAAYILGHTFATYGGLSPKATIQTAFGVALGFIVPAFGVNYLFAGKSVRLFAIDAGYWLLTYSAMGLIFVWLG